MDRVIYNGTFYSQVELPNYSGLLNENIEFGFKENSNEDFFGMDIDAFFTMTDLNNNKTFVVLKSQSRFVIQKGLDFTDNDAYEIIKHSIVALKSYRDKGYENISSNLERIPILTKIDLTKDVLKLMKSYFDWKTRAKLN